MVSRVPQVAVSGPPLRGYRTGPQGGVAGSIPSSAQEAASDLRYPYRFGILPSCMDGDLTKLGSRRVRIHGAWRSCEELVPSLAIKRSLDRSDCVWKQFSKVR